MKSEVEIRIEEAKKRLEEARNTLKTAEKGLAAAYKDRYPVGRFYICRVRPRYYDAPPKAGECKALKCSIYWAAGKGSFGVTNSDNWGGRSKQAIPNWPGVVLAGWRSSYNSYETSYNSLDKMLKAAKKFKIPNPVVQAFLEKYRQKNPEPVVANANIEVIEEHADGKPVFDNTSLERVKIALRQGWLGMTEEAKADWRRSQLEKMVLQGDLPAGMGVTPAVTPGPLSWK